MKFRTKMTVWMTVLISLIYSIGGTLLMYLTFREFARQEQEKALNSYRMLRSTLVLANTISEQAELEDVTELLSQIDAQGGDWTSLRLRSGVEQLYDSGEALPFQTDLSGQCSTTLCAMTQLRQEERCYEQITGTFQVGDTTLYLDAAYDITEVYTLRSSQLRIYRALFAVVVVLSAAGSFLLSCILTRPLGHLSAVSRNIAGGDLALRANIHTGDEMERLASDFNSMAEHLVEQIHALEDAMQRQEAFMGSFAHELKTPMTSIIGYADLLRSCEMTDTERREAAGYIFSEGKRLESLSLKLLDLLVLRKQDFQLYPVSPAALLEDIAALMQENAYKKQIVLRYRAEEGTCLLEPDLVKSLLMNLIDNAVKALDETGGTVSVHLTLLADGCQYLIRDNGRGIPEEEIQRITEAFYRVDKSRSRRQGGAGLGLALCQEIVRLHHGSLEFASKPGGGTIVTVTLRGGAVS